MIVIDRIRALLNRITGRFSMYRLVLGALLAIAAASLVLSLVAQLSQNSQLFYYEPLELLASCAVAIVATAGSSAVLARIYRQPVNPESWLVTALLLFFLFAPSLDPVLLLTLAAAGIIASASKFVLAAGGRHWVNPAAFGAVVVGLAGLGYPNWWVATLWLLPVVAIGAFLVLYRTRKLALAGIYLLVYLAISVPQDLGFGMSVPSSLQTAFVSFPIVFFAGFMLSEPLTLPARRWQQWTIAALVGVLASGVIDMAAIGLGALSFTPQLALVIGNLLGLAFTAKRSLRLTLRGSRDLTPTSREYRLSAARALPFRAGQYLELEVPHRRDGRGHRRVFSISSAPGAEELTIAVKHSEPGSSFKKALRELPDGTVLHGRWLGGDFVLPEGDAPLLLAAGGIGVTPFISHLAEDLARGGTRDIVLLYAVSDAAELAYAEELTALGVRVLLAAPSPPATLPAGWSYLGDGRVTAARLAETVPDLGERIAYLSGPPGFVDGLRAGLRGRVRGRVRTDHFTGY